MTNTVYHVIIIPNERNKITYVLLRSPGKRAKRRPKCLVSSTRRNADIRFKENPGLTIFGLSTRDFLRCGVGFCQLPPLNLIARKTRAESPGQAQKKAPARG